MSAGEEDVGAANWGRGCWEGEPDGGGMSEGRIRVLANWTGSKSEGSMSEGSESESDTSSMRACWDILMVTVLRRFVESSIN